ncbi:MAG: GNAT family N-acetyltransferase, partial [Armatimonadetes bacterium]|nr:GNAT family N-acetyltransferase [Armatimonadota bacterium]
MPDFSRGPLFFREVTDPKDLTEIFKLRYLFNIRVGYIEKSSDGKEMESDSYDDLSTHLGAYDERGGLVGTLRIIHPSSHGFPMEKTFKIVLPPGRREKKLCEISRLNVRSRIGYPEHRATLGLIRTAKDVCLSQCLTHCCFAVDARVWEMYERLRFGFTRMGATRPYMGSPTVPAFVKVHGWLRYLRKT